MSMQLESNKSATANSSKITVEIKEVNSPINAVKVTNLQAGAFDGDGSD